MHELSLAGSIADIAERHARGRRVKRIHVRVGDLAQVVFDALSFSFEVVVQGTPLEGAQLDLEAVPAVGQCRACGELSTFSAFPLQCGACEGFELEIVSGEEFIVDSLDVEEAENGTDTGARDR